MRGVSNQKRAQTNSSTELNNPSYYRYKKIKYKNKKQNEICTFI